MDLHLKNFKQHSEYEDFKESEDFKDPNVSQCEKELHVHYSDISAATSITISETALDVNIDDETVQLEATLTPNVGEVIWKSNNPNIATVDDNGLVTLKTVGDVSIWAFSPNGKERARCKINCYELLPESFDIDKYVMTIERNEEETIAVINVLPEGASKRVDWTSSDETVATVDENGKVTGVNPGECIITARAHKKPELYKSCAVTCIGVTGVTLNKEYISIIPDETTQLIATVTPSTAPNKDVTWLSSDESIATVDANGLVSGITTGNCIITVTTVDGGKTDTCEVRVKKDYSKEYFQITAIEPSEAKFTVSNPGTGFFPQINIQYRVNSAATWSSWTSSQWSPTLTVSLQSNDTVEFKGAFTKQCGRFGNSTGKFTVAGNIMSLSDAENFREKKTLDDTRFFASLFNGCAPIESAEDLVLPATGLTDACYQDLFNGCTNLKRGPKLPATTLATSCYYGMFMNCTSLTEAPELPATTMAVSCYWVMFMNCKSLTEAPELPATTLANSCYKQMFQGCTSLTAVPEILPATTLDDSCYQYMFSGCTSITTAPELPAATLTSGSYYGMFNSCTSLNYIKCLATDISANVCTSGWVNSVAANGSFVKAASMSDWTTGVDGIPDNWVTQDE